MASGIAVIDDQKTMESAAEIQDNLYAIDMESYEIALAATALGTKWIVIKAVQDFADGQKENDEAGTRAFSSVRTIRVVFISFSKVAPVAQRPQITRYCFSAL